MAKIKIALAGNPNSGKTTLFNALTGSNQYVGNWPGVTVEKKDGLLAGDKDVTIQDLPGIYSLSPYSLEEKVSRKFLVEENPDAILNIVDGTNIERNLYLSTQLAELGIPMVMAVNMMDVVKKNGDKIDFAKIGKALNCEVTGISALKKEGGAEAAQLAARLAKEARKGESPHVFSGSVEHAIAHIEESIQGKVPARSIRWFAIKIFERDREVIKDLGIGVGEMKHIEAHIRDCEKELDDDAESIITNQRYEFIQNLMSKAVTRTQARKNKTTLSDKIDKFVTNRILALPLFVLALCAMWWVAVAENGPGTILTDWANDSFLGEDGWHLPFTTHTFKCGEPGCACKGDAKNCDCASCAFYAGKGYDEAKEAYAPHEKNIEAWESAYKEAYNEKYGEKDKDGNLTEAGAKAYETALAAWNEKAEKEFKPGKDGDRFEAEEFAVLDEALAAGVKAEVKLDDDEETGEPVTGVASIDSETHLVETEPCEHAPVECLMAKAADPGHSCGDCTGEEGEPKEACEHCEKVAKWRAAYIKAYDAKNGGGAYEAKLRGFNREAEAKWRKASGEAREAAKKEGKTYIPKSLFEESGFEIFDEAVAAGVAAQEGPMPGDCGCCGHEMSWECDYAAYKASKEVPEVDPSRFGVFIPGLKTLIGEALDAVGTGDKVKSLVLDGAWGGVATVLGFVPVISVVFLFLAFLEDCGYMARVAFIMDRLFRKFGLSGKSFIPMIVGKGCGVPAVMAARTIENERDHRMTVMLATFIPCGAKTVIIAMFAALFFRGQWYVAALMDVIGIAVIVMGGIALKKSKAFAGEAAPFVMELPAYHMPTAAGIWRHTWIRVKGYIMKAGLIIFPACVFLWFIMNYDFSFAHVGEEGIDRSMLAVAGGWLAWMLEPLGFGSWQGAAASVSAEIAKEQATATLGLVASNMPGGATGAQIKWLFASFSDFPKLAALSFMIFNLFIPPCMVAIAVTFREMGSKAWGWFAVGFQLFTGYVLAMSAYRIGVLAAGGGFGLWTAAALVLDAFCLWMVFRPAAKAGKEPAL